MNELQNKWIKSSKNKFLSLNSIHEVEDHVKVCY